VTRRRAADCAGRAFLREPPGDWTLRAVSAADEPIAEAGVTVPATGDGPVRVSLPVK
jgi:hypothetical protein